MSITFDKAQKALNRYQGCFLDTGSPLMKLVKTIAEIDPGKFRIYDSGLFVNPNIGTLFTAPHGLGKKPIAVRVKTVLVAADPNMAYPVGSEIDFQSWFSIATLDYPIQVSCDDTTITLTTDPVQGFIAGNEANLIAVEYLKNTIVTPASLANFQLRVYAVATNN